VHLLTMHKAKGLEYDHVILPALTQKSGGMDARGLLLWHERLNAAGVPRLFLGALTATGSDDSRLYTYLKTEKALKEKLESTRLLYIAVTRAIKSANLFGRLRMEESGDEAESSYKNPISASLLARIWPELEAQQESGLIELEWLTTGVMSSNPDDNQIGSPASQDNLADSFKRLDTPIALDERERAIVEQAPEPLAESDDNPSTDRLRRHMSGDRLASLIGTLVHEALEIYTKQETTVTVDELPAQMKKYWQTMLARLDLSIEQIEEQITHIASTLKSCLEHRDSQWLFASDPGNAQQESELSLISRLNGPLREHKVDRTLIDAFGTRWIVDYKTAQPRAGQSEEEFIAQQLSEYAGQLDRYRRLFAEMEQRPVRTALFLTAIPRLVEYEVSP